jgi:Membrane GTPase LepA
MLMMSTQAVHETLELGVISPEPIPSDGLGAGEVGYVISGVKDVRQARVGDTITTTTNKGKRTAAGYDHPKPMVFSGLYPVDGDEYPELRDALDKLQLTTRPWSTSRRRPPRSASASAAASSACCTWRSSGSGWSASST